MTKNLIGQSFYCFKIQEIQQIMFRSVSNVIGETILREKIIVLKQ